MQPPEDSGVLTWLIDHAWAPICVMFVALWTVNEASHKATRKVAAEALEAHEKEDEKLFKAVDNELQTQRGHIAKIFDQMREDSNKSEERHRELMERVHDNHNALLTALHTGLAGKADK